ncbi:MAG: hypothetical protein ACLFN8_02505 [Candidatus Woesearchaeota archaeon]
MNVSNKLLTLMLIITLAVSISSILININKLNAITTTGKSVYDQGFILLEIDQSVSITTIDGPFIDFGQCKLLGHSFNITSDGLKDTEESCEYFTQSNISVRNNGNIPARITMKTNDVGAGSGGTFLQTPTNTSQIAYKIANYGRAGNKGGCTENLGPQEYTLINQTNQDFDVCERLEAAGRGENNSIITNFEIAIPEDVSIGNAEIIITYTAQEY